MNLFEWAEQPRPIAESVRTQEPASVVTNEDGVRFNRQTQAIHEALKTGPKTRAELAEICLNVTARISDLRRGGVPVECVRRPGGNNLYQLVGTRGEP